MTSLMAEHKEKPRRGADGEEHVNALSVLWTVELREDRLYGGANNQPHHVQEQWLTWLQRVSAQVSQSLSRAQHLHKACIHGNYTEQ